MSAAHDRDLGAAAEPMLTGAELLDRLRAELTSYVALPSEEATDAVVLWIATTHALSAFDFAPRLAITSPEKRCGKSRLLDVIEATCHDPLATADASVAAIVRSIGRDRPPTLLIDEADAKFGTKRNAENHEDLRAMLNAGHERGRDSRRCVGPLQRVEAFPTFAMAALAGIGTLPDTISDRAVNVRMQRRPRDRQVSAFRRRRDVPALNALRDQLASWVESVLDKLAAAEPDMPVEDRAADTWEPMVVVADVAGGDWPTRARRACVQLTGQAEAADTAESLGRLLLADVRAVFATAGRVALPSAELVTRLRAVEESPWTAFELDARKLARRLGEYGVKPERIEHDGRQVRGYRLTELHEPFARYLPPPERPDGPGPSASASVKPSEPQVIPLTDGVDLTDVSVSSSVSVSGVSREDDGLTDADASGQAACDRCGRPSDFSLIRGRCRRCAYPNGAAS